MSPAVGPLSSSLSVVNLVGTVLGLVTSLAPDFFSGSLTTETYGERSKQARFATPVPPSFESCTVAFIEQDTVMITDQEARYSAPATTDSQASTHEVSIVMPCLNEAETLAACIEKAQRSSRENNIAGEIVVADNGSTDGSQALAESPA